MSDLTRAINNYMAVNNKKSLTEEEALELLKYFNESKKAEEESLESEN